MWKIEATSNASRVIIGMEVKMSDFAYAYFNTELDKLDIPALEGIFEKVKQLLAKKTH